MAGKHSTPKPSPYSIAAGAVTYALAITFSKHVPVGLVASIPAAVAVAVGAVERGVAELDPKAAPVVDRLAAQALSAAKDVAAVVASGVKDAPTVVQEIQPLVG